jgi:hypothetical protein
MLCNVVFGLWQVAGKLSGVIVGAVPLALGVKVIRTPLSIFH